METTHTNKSQPEANSTLDGTEALIKMVALERATGISRFKWYALARDNKIPTYSCGRALRFKLSEILQWMKAQGK